MKFKSPTKFDYNLIVIGAGSAGLVSAYLAAALKARVALVEKNKMGGDCLNTGCVPSKALIRSAKIIHLAKHAQKFGFQSANVSFDFAQVMERVQRVIKKIEPHDSIERYTTLGVECLQGAARIHSPHEVEVNGKVLTTRSIIIATGARPFIPPLPGIEDIRPLTSENLWQLRELPKKLVVVGGGAIGSELAQAFSRLGSNVTQVESGPRIMEKEDIDVSQMIREQFEKEGIKVLTDHEATAFKVQNDRKFLITRTENGTNEIEFDQVLIAVGRKANASGFGLEQLGVKLRKQGTIDADPYLATNFKNIFVCGDVTGPFQFTHTAAHQAYFACMNSLFHPITRWLPPPFSKNVRVNYDVIPWATYTDPEVATVGETETSARLKGIDYELTTYGIDDLDRAITEEEDRGLVKVLTAPGKDKILGATIVSAHAGELITEFIAAMKHGFGLKDILGTIHIYPTMSEANKYAAGRWRKARSPKAALKALEHFHRWRRR